MAWAQVSAPVLPLPGYRNSVSGGISYGVQNDRDADFWGWSLDYGRQLGENWIGAASLTWDRETEQFNDSPDKQVDTFNVIGTISYALSSRISLTTGLAKGIGDTDNPTGSMKFNSGDWGTGIALGYSIPGLPHFIRDSISLSAAYEYNISQRETSVSFDVSIGVSY